MIGLFSFGLIIFMIYTLVKNALVGVQLNAKDSFEGSIELIIPITPRSEFHLEAWLKSLQEFRILNHRLKIHLLIDGHHPVITAWEELHQKLPLVELHTFPLRPENSSPAAWMISQVASKIQSDVVILGDPEITPSEGALLSIAYHVLSKNTPLLALPQTYRGPRLGEAIAALNPTLTFASVFGFKRYRRNLSHPLLSLSQAWLGMGQRTFKDLHFDRHFKPSWKQSICEQWDRGGMTFHLGFGEKLLQRNYPDHFMLQLHQMKTYWDELWTKGERTGLWIYLVCLFIWSFPIFFFTSKPFWSLLMIFLLAVYRFFTKVVFQERWSAIFLHPVSILVWVGTFFWWAFEGLRHRYRNPGPIQG
jgi:hypothetical protein